MIIKTDLEHIIKHLNHEYDSIYQSLNHSNKDRADLTNEYLKGWLPEIKDNITRLSKYLPLSLSDTAIQNEAVYNLNHVECSVRIRRDYYFRHSRKKIKYYPAENQSRIVGTSEYGGIFQMTMNLGYELQEIMDIILDTRFLPLS